MGNTRLRSFLRWSLQTLEREDEVLACKLVNEELEAGHKLNDLFGNDSEDGYLLHVERVGFLAYRIKFGYYAGPLAGDGGEWEVVFTPAGKVAAGRLLSKWIS